MVFLQIACFIIKGLETDWCLSAVTLFSQCFTASLGGVSERLGEPGGGERQPSSQVVQPSIAARSITAPFTEELFAYPSNGSVQRLYLTDARSQTACYLYSNTLTLSWVISRGFEQGDFSGSRAEMRNIGRAGGATLHMRLQGGVGSGSQLH